MDTVGPAQIAPLTSAQILMVTHSVARGYSSAIVDAGGFPMNLSYGILKSLSASSCIDGAKCFPTVLIDDKRLLRLREELRGESAADMALHYYRAHSFVGERSRMNEHGYAAILRELRAPPPWVTVEMEDCMGDISEERSAELRSLVQQVHAYSDEALLSRLREHWEERRAGYRLMHLGDVPV